ncbi:hypothetical protein [uncultured Oscillibacter sp.]|uniref:hypothetical protein n=1 Tax=uncultured Oscillibacter sp. TaxID=876091 RepID=UPI002621588A|nr:hypothetical protein [uncultured Oscillibacter sp.]
MSKEVRTLLPSDSKPKADEMLAFLDTLDQSGQRSLLDFFQGARFMQSLMTNTQQSDIRPSS